MTTFKKITAALLAVTLLSSISVFGMGTSTFANGAQFDQNASATGSANSIPKPWLFQKIHEGYNYVNTGLGCYRQPLVNFFTAPAVKNTAKVGAGIVGIYGLYKVLSWASTARASTIKHYFPRLSSWFALQKNRMRGFFGTIDATIAEQVQKIDPLDHIYDMAYDGPARHFDNVKARAENAAREVGKDTFKGLFKAAPADQAAPRA